MRQPTEKAAATVLIINIPALIMRREMITAFIETYLYEITLSIDEIIREK
jgi:hypothetical protein